MNIKKRQKVTSSRDKSDHCTSLKLLATITGATYAGSWLERNMPRKHMTPLTTAHHFPKVRTSKTSPCQPWSRDSKKLWAEVLITLQRRKDVFRWGRGTSSCVCRCSSKKTTQSMKKYNLSLFPMNRKCRVLGRRFSLWIIYHTSMKTQV